MSINDPWSIHYPDRIFKDRIFSISSRILKARLSGRNYPSLMNGRLLYMIDLDYVNKPIKDEYLGYDLTYLRKGIMEHSPMPFKIA